MNYFYLRPKNKSLLFIEDKIARDAVINNILALRASLDKEIPDKKLTGNLVLGTWNIREFGNTKYNGRMTESLYYIAEIISRFDLIAIQEVRTDMAEFNQMLNILGEDYGVHVSIVTQGKSGNSERLAFLYDKRTVSFKNIAGQVILPKTTKQQDQFARAPYVIRFQSGWIKFDIATVHIYYGDDVKSGAKYKKRVEEIGQIVKYFSDFYINDKGKNEADNMFILGDFNIEDTKSDTYKAATSARFAIPDSILNGNLPGSNQLQTKIYDQILYYSKYNNIKFSAAGVYNLYDTVFNDFSQYQERIEAHYGKKLAKKDFTDFRSYQMSDHLPLWIEMKTDLADSYLEYIKKSAQ
ncbi:MAG: endonuclease/exonuclease/phosphatase family protein [Chitinophagaceae bacterium]|nr:endonuclease/exonuclease/phosphatase family protein [Chitinophagaceae bacterium]